MSSINLSKKTVNLSKSQTVNLSKQSEGLKKIMIGLGWDENEGDVTIVQDVVQPGFIGKLFGAKEKVVERRIVNKSAYDYDLDAWVAFMKDGETKKSQDTICYYHNKEMKNNGQICIKHCGDNLTGAGDGDDEQIIVDLSNIPDKYNGILVGVTIYQGTQRKQKFGDIKNMFVRIVDQNDDFEICKYADSIASEYKDCYTFYVGRLYKDKGEWQFKADGFGTKSSSIESAVRDYKG